MFSPLPSSKHKILRPDAIRLNGIIGNRFSSSRINRLHRQEDEYLLWPFQEHTPVATRGWIVEKPPHPEITRGDWQGEFIGTWINAACLSAWHAGDVLLREKVDDLVNRWLATQEEDGYLGAYDEIDRWKSWDVWIQAHNILGLLSYYGYTGENKALNAAVRVADRVMRDFGPGKAYLHTGPHGGMASSAILEPMVWLYWETKNERYLHFGRWLVDEDWEAPGGIAIVSSLLSGRGVAGTANGKGAEMLICFSGLLELYCATGEERYLKTVLVAWDDIVQHHLYITGSASAGEHFHSNFLLHNDGVYRIGETCVTMAWLYLNFKLGAITGEARFYDAAEQSLYNHLLGAQSPDGRGWAYYLGLRDSKRFRWHTDPDCCPTRGVRALAQAPMHFITTCDDGFVVNFYEDSEAGFQLPSGRSIQVHIETRYPFAGDIKITLSLAEPSQFRVRLRVPGWCEEWETSLNGCPQPCSTDASGYLGIERCWRSGDQIELRLKMPVNLLADAFGNNGCVAFTRGPFVYAADQRYLPEGVTVDDVILHLPKANPGDGIRLIDCADTGSVHLVVPMAMVAPDPGPEAWKVRSRYFRLKDLKAKITPVDIRLVPFFEAGITDPDAYKDGVWVNTEPVTKITFRVWLPTRVLAA